MITERRCPAVRVGFAERRAPHPGCQSRPVRVGGTGPLAGRL